jgi:hypothetical protein
MATAEKNWLIEKRRGEKRSRHRLSNIPSTFMPVHVSSPFGSVEIAVPKSGTVHDVRIAIAQKTSFGQSNQPLTIAGKFLTNDSTRIMHTLIRPNSTVIRIVPMAGGYFHASNRFSG